MTAFCVEEEAAYGLMGAVCGWVILFNDLSADVT